ncbi:hypothetical protein JCM21900_005972 [Sporobolomyces salmonicolor]
MAESPNASGFLDQTLDDSYFSEQAPPSDLSAAIANMPNDSVEDLDPSLSGVSSPGARSTSVDSLANASWSEVEARALEFLASSPPTAEQELKHTGGGLDAFDLPRKVPSLPSEQLEAQRKALDFLRKKLDDADKDDWRYPTPAVFGPPKPLGLRTATGGMVGPERGREHEEGINWDEGTRDGSNWMDRAFNLERYQVDGLSQPMDDLALARDEPIEEDFGASRFGDATAEGHYGFAGR